MQLFVAELAEKVDSEWVVINTVTPGMCRTQLNRESDGTVRGLCLWVCAVACGVQGRGGREDVGGGCCCWEGDAWGVFGVGEEAVEAVSFFFFFFSFFFGCLVEDWC